MTDGYRVYVIMLQKMPFCQAASHRAVTARRIGDDIDKNRNFYNIFHTSNTPNQFV